MTELNSREAAGSDSPDEPKSKSSGWKNLLLVVIVTSVSVWLAERTFVAYEQSQLVPRLPEIDGSGPINLAALLYNDRTVSRQTLEGEYRILSFGDSFTHSVMEPPLSYNGIIQKRLQEVRPDTKFKVINLGEPATGTRHFREAHDFWSQVLEHDAVLFHIFLGNDILDGTFIHASLGWAPNDAVFNSDNPILAAGNRRVPQKFPLRMMDYAYAWWMSSRTRGDDLPDGYNWAALTSFDEPTFDRINFKFLENFDPGKMNEFLAGYEQVFYLLERAQEISEAGTSVMVVLGPAEPQVDDKIRNRALHANRADAAAYDLTLAQRIITRLRDRIAPDVPLFDLSDIFIEEYKENPEKLYFRRNTHWNQAGNQLAGTAIASAIESSWFNGKQLLEPSNPSSTMSLVSEEEIDHFLAPLTDGSYTGTYRVSGAVRAIQMFDGISSRNDNWAIAPLEQEILIELQSPKLLATVLLDLYSSDDRTYRFTVEALSGEQWVMLADQSKDAVGGSILIPVDREISALRLVGLHNSQQEKNPNNTFIHIEEITLIEKGQEAANK
jgi:hypothetical protein